MLNEGVVNGKSVKRIQIDTGASRTLVNSDVNSDVVPDAELTGEKVNVTLATGAKELWQRWKLNSDLQRGGSDCRRSGRRRYIRTGRAHMSTCNQQIDIGRVV